MLDDLYQEVILDHSKRPRNFHQMDDATRDVEGYNPAVRRQAEAVRENGWRDGPGYQLRGRGLRHLDGLGIVDDRNRKRQIRARKPCS